MQWPRDDDHYSRAGSPPGSRVGPRAGLGVEPVGAAQCDLAGRVNLITAELSAQELVEIVREDRQDRQSDRVLWPFELEMDRLLFKGEPVATERRFTIGFNSYDGQSAGKRLMRLRAIVASPGAKRRLTQLDTRSALINGLLDRREIS